MTKKTVSKAAKEKFTQVLSQAKDSLKMLEMATAQAKALVNLPKAKDISNEKLLQGLKKLGLATQEDLKTLSARIEKLEAKAESETETTA